MLMHEGMDSEKIKPTLINNENYFYIFFFKLYHSILWNEKIFIYCHPSYLLHDDSLVIKSQIFIFTFF